MNNERGKGKQKSFPKWSLEGYLSELEVTELSHEQLGKVLGGISLRTLHEEWHQLSPKEQVFAIFGTLGTLTLLGLAVYYHETIGKGLNAIGGRITNAFKKDVEQGPSLSAIEEIDHSEPPSPLMTNRATHGWTQQKDFEIFETVENQIDKPETLEHYNIGKYFDVTSFHNEETSYVVASSSSNELLKHADFDNAASRFTIVGSRPEVAYIIPRGYWLLHYPIYKAIGGEISQLDLKSLSSEDKACLHYLAKKKLGLAAGVETFFYFRKIYHTNNPLDTRSCVLKARDFYGYA